MGQGSGEQFRMFAAAEVADTIRGVADANQGGVLSEAGTT